MLKEWTRDYATGAFIRYANRGCPSAAEYEESVRKDVYKRLNLQPPNVIVMRAEAALSARRPLIEDFEAVRKTIEHFKHQNKEIIALAIVEVYKGLPEMRPISSNEITNRVRGFCTRHYVSESTVYRGLKQARLLFSRFRGIEIGVSGDDFLF